MTMCCGGGLGTATLIQRWGVRTIFEPEHEDFRESVRGFLRKEAVPKTEEWEAAGVIDRGFWRKAAEQGFVAFSAPEEHGGLGIDDFRFNAIIDEECAYTGAVDGQLRAGQRHRHAVPDRAHQRRAAGALAAGRDLRRHRARDRDDRARDGLGPARDRLRREVGRLDLAAERLEDVRVIRASRPTS